MVRHDHSIEANRYGEHLSPRCFSSLRTGPGRTLGRFSFVLAFLLRTRRWAARFFSAVWAAVLVPWLLEDDMEMMVYKGIGVPTEPEERFVCPNCDLDDFPEVTTECGHRVCKECAAVCDGPCGAIYCPDCTYEHERGYVCHECLLELEAAELADEAA